MLLLHKKRCLSIHAHAKLLHLNAICWCVHVRESAHEIEERAQETEKAKSGYLCVSASNQPNNTEEPGEGRRKIPAWGRWSQGHGDAAWTQTHSDGASAAVHAEPSALLHSAPDISHRRKSGDRQQPRAASWQLLLRTIPSSWHLFPAANRRMLHPAKGTVQRERRDGGWAISVKLNF